MALQTNSTGMKEAGLPSLTIFSGVSLSLLFYLEPQESWNRGITLGTELCWALYKVHKDGPCLYFSLAAPTGMAASPSFSAGAGPEEPGTDNLRFIYQSANCQMGILYTDATEIWIWTQRNCGNGGTGHAMLCLDFVESIAGHPVASSLCPLQLRIKPPSFTFGQVPRNQSDERPSLPLKQFLLLRDHGPPPPHVPTGASPCPGALPAQLFAQVALGSAWEEPLRPPHQSCWGTGAVPTSRFISSKGPWQHAS